MGLALAQRHHRSLVGVLSSFAATVGVKQLDRRAFENRRIASVTIPRHVQILCSSCFSYYNSLSSISFESDSELTRVGAGAFAVTRLTLVVVPASVLFIAGDAFPTYCTVQLPGEDTNARFREWAECCGEPGASEAFERKACECESGSGRRCNMTGSGKTVRVVRECC
jgi:hypothetical protein